MGWRLSRRKNRFADVVFLFLFPLFAFPIFGEAPTETRPERMRISPTIPAVSTETYPTRQGLRAPEVYSVEIDFATEAEEDYREMVRPEALSSLAYTLDRARIYRNFIQQALIEADLPPELVFLPVIESSYRPDARSSAGAAGLWQFMPISADHYGLAMNNWIDERLDPFLETEAAMDLLADNFRLTENWLWALAAYNTGITRMRSIIAAHPETDTWSILLSSVLPEETRRYLPIFLAVVRIGSYPGRHGIEPSWTALPAWTRIPLQTPVHLDRLAVQAELDRDLLDLGNRGLRYSVTPPGNYQLNIPADREEAVHRILSETPEAVASYDIYRIRSGDTLYALAQYYEINLDDLLQTNPDLDPRRLRIGSQVLIPVYDNRPGYPGSAPSEEELHAAGSHVVVEGDTLWGISRKYAVDLEDLLQINGMRSDDILRTGTRLSVPERQP